MRAAGACPARHLLVVCCHARCGAAAALLAPVRCRGVLRGDVAVLAHSNVMQGGRSRPRRAGWLTVHASHAGWSARRRRLRRGCRWRAWPRGGMPRWAPWGGCAGSSRAQPSGRTPRDMPALEGAEQALLQRGVAASGQTALCACPWQNRTTLWPERDGSVVWQGFAVTDLCAGSAGLRNACGAAQQQLGGGAAARGRATGANCVQYLSIQCCIAPGGQTPDVGRALQRSLSTCWKPVKS
jgi:hypothetical protein